MGAKTITLMLPGGAVLALEADAAGRVWRVTKHTDASAPADAAHVVLDERAVKQLRDLLKPTRK